MDSCYGEGGWLMLEKKPIRMYYFSGTGNTLLIAKKMKEAFEKKGYKVTLSKMPISGPVQLEKDCHLGIIVPVAIQSTFPIVWDFIDRLPAGNRRQVFLADTMESFSGGIVGPMKKILDKKGYTCIAAHEFKMSTSMQTAEKKVIEGKEKDKKALIEAEDYVNAIIEEQATWKRIPILSDAMRGISKGQGIWEKTGERLQIEQEQCTQCGLCEKCCPMEAIHVVDGKMTINYKQCISCMRCANFCTQQAFTLGNKPVIQKKVVKLGELMKG